MKKITQDFSKFIEADMVVRDVIHRYKVKKMGSVVYIIGLSGTGKSSTSQRTAELITERCAYEPQTYLVDSLLTFLDALIKSKLGDIIVIEEISVLFPSRRAMSGENLAIAKVLDTVRKKQLCIIANAPIWNSIDSHMRAMGNILIETLKIRRGEDVVVSKCHRLQTNPSSGKTYRHSYQRTGREVKLMYTKMPNSERWAEYERRKDEFMLKLYENLKAKAIKKDKQENKLVENVKPSIKELTAKELQVHTLVNVKGMKRLEVAKIMGVCHQRITAMLQNIVKKSLNTKENDRFNTLNPITNSLN